MTSMIKSETPSNMILDSLNRLNIAKQTGGLNSDELSRIIMLEGNLFSNLVSMGKKNEEEVNDFEKELVSNDQYFSHNHKGLDVASKTIMQDNAAALYDRENRFGFTKRI